MAGRAARLSIRGMTLTRIFAAVLALDVIGLVITLIAGNEDLVEALVISQATVKTHVRHVLLKLGLRDRVQIVALAYEAGLL
jgi:DNA-binding CsgD family transcriptional regulator